MVDLNLTLGEATVRFLGQCQLYSNLNGLGITLRGGLGTRMWSTHAFVLLNQLDFIKLIIIVVIFVMLVNALLKIMVFEVNEKI